MKRILLIVFAFANSILISAQKTSLNDYNIVWTTPGINAQGSMPLGNGDIGINAWVAQNGDLLFYVSKTDAWSENGQLLKLGLIRIVLSPNLFDSATFIQKLTLEKGEILIDYGATQMKLWVDANHPTIQIDIDSKQPLKGVVSFETWRKQHRQVNGAETGALYGLNEIGKDRNFIHPVFIEPDSILPKENNRIISWHHNNYSQWKKNLELQALGAYAQNNADPLLNRTFGLAIEGKGFINTSDTSLSSNKPSNHLQLNIYALTETGTIASWKKSLVKISDTIKNVPLQKRIAAHYAWWQKFWNRNYIFITGKDSTNQQQAEAVTQGYILQRFINACGGRGNSPIKFNGSIFTVDTYNRQGANAGLNADFRAWGGCYWWQNTRLPYWSMLIAGDFELMTPMFKMYMNALPLRKMATQQYYHHAGAFFPETLNFWGTYNNNNYGTHRDTLPDGFTTNTYIRYYWQGGLELSLMMLDYFSFTNRNAFAKDTLVPFVSEILTFFDQHWKRGDDGKILFSPAMSLETYQEAVNPLPEVVGIRTVADKMLALPASFFSDEQREQWKKLLKDLPTIPIRIVNNDTLLAPAATYSKKQNIENPELYAIFPYRQYTIGKQNTELGKRTFALRTH